MKSTCRGLTIILVCFSSASGDGMEHSKTNRLDMDDLGQDVGKIRMKKVKIGRENLRVVAGAGVVYMLVFRLAGKIWGNKRNKGRGYSFSQLFIKRVNLPHRAVNETLGKHV